jgi:hypothetical protein
MDADARARYEADPGQRLDPDDPRAGRPRDVDRPGRPPRQRPVHRRARQGRRQADPVYFVEPYTWRFEFVLKPDWALLEYACEERPHELAPGVVPDN